jgi:hypothetical protein
LAKTFIALASEGRIRRVTQGLILQKAADYAPSPKDSDFVAKSDVPWLDRFAAAGGYAIISGDLKMRERLHERLALSHHGFVVIFFDPRWNQSNFFRKTALMVFWWEEIVLKIKSADKGTFWIVPSKWPKTPGQLRNMSLGLTRLLKGSPSDRPKIHKPAPRRPARSADDRQSALRLHDKPDGFKP